MKQLFFLVVGDNYEEYPEFGFTRLFNTNEEQLEEQAKQLNKTDIDSREYFYVKDHPVGKCLDGGGDKLLTRMRPKMSLLGLVGSYVKVNDDYLEIIDVNEENEYVVTRNGREFWFDETTYFTKE